MADILAGLSGHTGQAPLSAEHTIQVCQYLHDLIKQNEGNITFIKNNMGQDDGPFVMINRRIDAHDKGHRDLQDEFKELSARCDLMIHKELEKTNGEVKKLRSALDDMLERLNQVTEAQRLANGNIMKLEQAHAQSDTILQAVRDTVEKQVAGDIERLFQMVRNLESNVTQLGDNDQKLSENLRQHREEIRTLTGNVEKLNVTTLQTETKTQLLDQRVSEACSGLKTLRANTDELQAQVTKLHEDHECTKVMTVDNRTNIKNLNAFLGIVRSDVDKHTAEINADKRKIQETAEQLEARRRSMERIDQNVRGVQQQTTQLHQTTTLLTEHVTDAREIAIKAQQDLATTNSMVLPNLKPISPTGSRPASGLPPLSGSRSPGAISPINPSSPVGSRPPSGKSRPQTIGQYVDSALS